MNGAYHLPGSALHNEVTHFLYVEAELLDNSRYSDWFALFTEDVRYWMPVRTTRFLAAGKGFDEDMALIDDNHISLKTRAKRLESDAAWAESPPSRTRHFITNVIVEDGAAAGEIAVSSCFMVTRTRSDRDYQFFTGVRNDTLRRVEGGFLIARRKILIDQTVITNTNLSILF